MLQDFRIVQRGPDLVLIRTRLDRSLKIFGALTRRPLAIGDWLCPLAGGELSWIDDVDGHHINAAAARPQHVIVPGQHVIGAGWPLQPGDMNALLFANSLIEGIRQIAIRIGGILLALPHNVGNAASAPTTAPAAGFKQRYGSGTAQADGSCPLKKSTTGHTAFSNLNNNFV